MLAHSESPVSLEARNRDAYGKNTRSPLGGSFLWKAIIGLLKLAVQPLILDLQVDNAQAINSINAFFDIYEKGVDGMSKTLSDALGKDVEIGVQLKMEGDKLIAEGVEKVDKSVQKVEASAKLVNGELGKTPNVLRQQLSILKSVQGDTKKWSDKTGDVTAEWKALSDMIDKVQGKLNKMSQNSGGVDLTSKLVASQIAADALMGSFQMLTGAVTSFVKSGMEMEILFIQLQGFTGGVEQAAEAYDEFVKIGQSTPFTAKEVATAARTMMGFGIETGTAIEQVRNLAIVASATGGELTHMARNMGQIQANQKAYTRDLMQFANQGIPIYQEMADLLGVSTGQIRKMAEEGEIGFGLVSTAIRNMTEEGSAFAIIADKMDATFAAKLEAMVSAVQSFAGNFTAMVNEFDAATGGLVSGSLQLLINGINDLSSFASDLTLNMKKFAPIIAGISAAMVTLIALTIKANWAAFSAAIMTAMKATKLWTVAVNGLNAAKAILAALTGNIPKLLIAFGAAAGVAAIATRNFKSKQEQLNKETGKFEPIAVATADAINEEVFNLKQAPKAIKDVIKEKKKLYDVAKEELDIARQRAKIGLDWIKDEYEAFKELNDDKMDVVRSNMDEERGRHQENMREIREKYDAMIGDERELLAQIRERYAVERDEINDKSDAESKLADIRRRELELKAKGIEYSRTAADQAAIERLEAQAALDRLDRQIDLEKNRAEEKAEVAEAEQKLKDLEEDKDGAIKAEEALHKSRMTNFEKELASLTELDDKEKKKVEDAQKAYDSLYGDVQKAQFDTHEDAMGYIQDQITEANKLKTAMVNAANEAAAAWRKAAQEAQRAQEIANANNGGGSPSGNAGNSDPRPVRGFTDPLFGPGSENYRFAGGAVQGGSKYTVNELGKEAFLSASGRLSMINARSFGSWTAPSSGTVIPAHLTQQLDIPAGGVNISGNPGLNAAGSVNGLARAISGIQGGSNISNNVTIQSANPTQSANNMLVQLQKIRSTRLGRR